MCVLIIVSMRVSDQSLHVGMYMFITSYYLCLTKIVQYTFTVFLFLWYCYPYMVCGHCVLLCCTVTLVLRPAQTTETQRDILVLHQQNKLSVNGDWFPHALQ